MKKHIALFLSAVVALFVFGAFAQSTDSDPLFSFRGVLYGILKEAEDIASEITNPFSDGKSTESSAASQTSSENSFSFAVLGDTQRFSPGNPSGNFHRAVASIKKLNPALVIAEGDLVG